jgi:hypothetical protein
VPVWHARFVDWLVESIPLDKPEPIKQQGAVGAAPCLCNNARRSDARNMSQPLVYVNKGLPARRESAMVAGTHRFR